MIKQYNFLFMRDIIDKLVFYEDFSYGMDGDKEPPQKEVFFLLEEIYTIFDCRLQISSIKYFNSITDKLAFKWHKDNSNPKEKEINHTFLLYMQGCEGSILQIKDSDDILVEPYNLYYLNTTVIHRAKKGFHGKFLKFTFI